MKKCVRPERVDEISIFNSQHWQQTNMALKGKRERGGRDRCADQMFYSCFALKD